MKQMKHRVVLKWMQSISVACALVWMTVGCASSSGVRHWTRNEVYFGLSKPDGSTVTPEQWQAFMNEVVTPQFPQGLSILDTAGQWRNASGNIDREPGKLLVLIHPRDRAMEERVNRICQQYRERFQQEAVMKVTSRAEVAF